MKNRDLSIDMFKGFLVFGMIYCHVLQFFCDLSANKAADYITWYINIITFSGFVFSFGYTCQIAYFSKDLKNVYKNMLTTSLKVLIAFYISGIYFRVFVDGKPLAFSTIKNIILLNDIPGWSEFLISFALFILFAAMLFKPLKKLLDKKILFFIVFTLLFFTTLIPYEKISINQVGLIIGSTQFASFPILQYMPFFLLGMYFKHYQITYNKKFLVGGVILSGTGLLYMALNSWNLPGRFPPTIFWLCLPMVFLYLYYLISKLLEMKEITIGLLLIMGKNTLFFLLMSNIIIFTLKGMNKRINLNGITGLLFSFLIIIIVRYFIFIIRNNGNEVRSSA